MNDAAAAFHAKLDELLQEKVRLKVKVEALLKAHGPNPGFEAISEGLHLAAQVIRSDGLLNQLIISRLEELKEIAG